MNHNIKEYFQAISDELKFNQWENTREIEVYTHKIIKLYQDGGMDEIAGEIETAFLKMSSSSTNTLTAIYFYSAALAVRYSSYVLEQFMEYCWECREQIPPYTILFLAQQFNYIIFVHSELNYFNTKLMLWRLLDYVIALYETAISDMLCPIVAENRNSEFVIVLTDQFIGYAHGPSKTAADRCKILVENMGKKVLLVNTAEMMNDVGEIPYIGTKYGVYNDELKKAECLEWKSSRIPYFQCDNDMPNIATVKVLLSMVQKQRPAYVVSIGAGEIVAALVSKIVPTICVGLGPADISVTGVEYQTLSRQLNDEDRRLLKAVGRTEESVVVGIFGSSILSREKERSREEANLPSETWLAAVVGGRLETECDSAFWNMAEESLKLGIEYVIMGSYAEEKIKKVYEEYPHLQGKVHFMGFVKDLIGHLELCDLYINPIRRGGGTSAVEALSLGIPVLTTNLGDVAVNVGENFWTESYDTMLNDIKRYMTDPEFYKAQCISAKERAEILLNAEDSFQKIIADFLSRAESKR